ncbi:MAG: pilus assembly protein PilM, partial [Candidatus Omnitrophota bacterium]
VKKGFIISRLLSLSVSALDDTDVSNMIKGVIQSENIKISNLSVLISRDRVMLKYIKLPSSNQDELDSMVSFEVSKQIPYSIEEVVYDYKIVSSDDQGYSNVIIAIVHNKEIEKTRNLLESVTKAPFRLRLSSEALYTWYVKISPNYDKSKRVCILDVDADSTEIVLVFNEEVEFTRTVSAGALVLADVVPGDSSQRVRFVEELRRSIDIFFKQKGSDDEKIDECLIIGALSVKDSLPSLIEKELGLKSTYVSFLATMPIAEYAFGQDGIPEYISVSSLCASLFITEGMNLVPEEVRKKEEFRSKAKKVVFTAVVLSVAVLSLVGFFCVKLYQKRALLGRLSAIYEKIKPQASIVEEKVKKLDIVKSGSKEGVSSLDAIYNLYKIIPPNITLVDFDYDAEKRFVSFRGTASRMAEVLKLNALLEASGRFKNVESRSLSERRLAGIQVIDFQIRCNFSSKAEKK